MKKVETSECINLNNFFEDDDWYAIVTFKEPNYTYYLKKGFIIIDLNVGWSILYIHNLHSRLDIFVLHFWYVPWCEGRKCKSLVLSLWTCPDFFQNVNVAIVGVVDTDATLNCA